MRIIFSIVLLSLLGGWGRIDLTADKRYTLSEPTCRMLHDLDAPVTVDILLDGDLNPGFVRLKKAAEETVEEMNKASKVRIAIGKGEGLETLKKQLQPSVIHERENNGRTVQTTVYPYAVIHYKGRTHTLSLLTNRRDQSGEENINSSIENMEFAFAEALQLLCQDSVECIAFLEGHGELTEHDTYDLTQALSHYFQVDRGTLNNTYGILDGYKVVIIADPQDAFSEADKYILDQYVMQGGRILWLVSGVEFSDNMLSDEGFTPVLPHRINLTDLFFRYGIRINADLVQDLQCLPVPVEVSGRRQPDGSAQFQPLPWTYAPLLLTSEASPITHNVMQVFGTFVSSVDLVGDDEQLHQQVLLATSTASRRTGTPAEVDLSDLNADPEQFNSAFLPVAALTEGQFTSHFAHLMPPEEIKGAPTTRKESPVTKQIMVACGNIARNEWHQGQPLPAGFDRYTRTMFGNRDFLVNAVLYLADDNGLIQLRNKNIQLRLLNDRRAHQLKTRIQIAGIALPIAVLGLVGLLCYLFRKKQARQS